MKKILALIFISLFSLCSIFGQGGSMVSENASEVRQTLLPVEVYVGDDAELRYSFRSAVDFFPGAPLVLEKQIDTRRLPFTELQNSFLVKSAFFTRNDMEYTISIKLSPWRTGIIEFPSFDLFSVLGVSEKYENKNISYTVLLEPIEIKSIVEKTQIRETQAPAPPLIVPGTTYVIFAVILSAFVLLIFILRALIKFGDIRRWFKYLKIHRAYRRNSIIATRKIKRLLRTKNLSDIDFCAGLQNITRTYLAFRFDYPFESVSAMGIRNSFSRICCGEIPPVIAYSVEDLTSMFIRTDYIRFAHDSIDSQLYPPAEHQAKLVGGERKSLADMILKAISVFESDGESEEEVNVL